MNQSQKYSAVPRYAASRAPPCAPRRLHLIETPSSPSPSSPSSSPPPRHLDQPAENRSDRRAQTEVSPTRPSSQPPRDLQGISRTASWSSAHPFAFPAVASGAIYEPPHNYNYDELSSSPTLKNAVKSSAVRSLTTASGTATSSPRLGRRRHYSRSDPQTPSWKYSSAPGPSLQPGARRGEPTSIIDPAINSGPYDYAVRSPVVSKPCSPARRVVTWPPVLSHQTANVPVPSTPPRPTTSWTSTPYGPLLLQLPRPFAGRYKRHYSPGQVDVNLAGQILYGTDDTGAFLFPPSRRK